jgi:hypothetical protein
MKGFEPSTPASRKQCATKLRYIPPEYSITHITHQAKKEAVPPEYFSNIDIWGFSG